MKNGLVLEGGGLRGMFTAGVVDALLEHDDIRFDGMIGVSAGALFGCNYKSRQKGRALRYNIKLKNDPRYMGLRSLIKTGDLVGSHFAYHVVPFEIDVFDAEAFRNNPIDFWMVCTDVINGTPVYHQMTEVCHHELDWMRASGSMPVVSRPVELDGYTLLDGGITDSIPLKKFQEMGYEKNVVVLTQPRDYFKTPSKINWIISAFTKKYPMIAECMKRRYEMYNGQLEYIAQEEKKGNTLILSPDRPLKIGRTEQNEAKMRACHQLGYTTALNRLQDIKDFLAY